MPNERKINEASSTPVIVHDIINMFSMYEPYITSWVTTNGPLLMKLAGALMAGYISLGMLKDMVLGIGSKQVSPEEKSRMIEKKIKKLEQEAKAGYLKTNKKIVKEVYNHMKVENLLFEFDRKEVLRLIIEALSVEDITAMKNAKDEQERKKMYKDLMRKYHPDSNPDNKEDAAVDIQKLGKLRDDPQKFADIYIRDAKRAGEEMPSDEELGEKFSDEQMVNVIRSVLAKLNTNPETKKPYTAEEKTADLALKLINDNIKSGNILLSKLIRVAKTKYGENFQDKFKQIIVSATEGWKQQTTGIDPEDQKRVNAFAEKVKAAFKPVIDKIAEAFEKTELFSDPDWVEQLSSILQKSKLNEEVTDEEVLKFVGLKAGPDGKLEGEQAQNLGKIVQALKKLKQKMIKDVDEYLEKATGADLEETILRVVKETLREQQIDPEGDDNIEAISTWQSKNNEFYEKAQKFLKGEYDGKGLDGLRSSFQSLGKPVLSEANYNQKEWFKGKKAGVFKSINEKNLNEAAFLLRGEIEKWTEGIENAMNELRKSIDSKPDRKAIGALKQRLRVWIDIYGTAEKILENYAQTDTEEKQELTPEKKEQLINVAKDATMFVKAYELIQKTLSKLLGVEPPKEIVIPDMQKLLNPPKGELTTVTDDPVDDDPVGDKKPEIKSDAFPISKIKFKDWYYKDSKTLQEEIKQKGGDNTIDEPRSMYKAFLDFKNDFTTVPMLKIQVAIFKQIYEKIEWLSNIDNLKKLGSQASKTAGRTKTQPEPAQTTPKTNQKMLPEQQGNSNQVELDEEDIQIFKDEYQRLLKLARIINKLIGKLNKATDLDTMGGGEIVKQSREIAGMLQDSLSRLHDTMSQELSDFVGKGGRLNEQEPDTDTNLEREQDFEAQMQSDADEILGVHEAVVGYLTTIDKAVRETKTETIDSNKILPRVKKVLDELNSIKKHFPSISPFGKETDDPEGMIEDMKIFLEGIVTDVEDLMQQLKGITTAEKKALKEATEKRYTDKQTVDLFLNKIVEVAQQVQDYFDAPSKIGEVSALRSKKITNMDNAAALNQAGIKAVQQGKAEAPQSEGDEDKDGPITSLSQAKKLLSRTRTELNKFFNAMVMRSKLDLGTSTENFIYPFFKMIVLLRNKDKEVNEVDSSFEVSGLAHLQQLGLDKDKVKELNIIFDKFKQDPTPPVKSVYRLMNKFIENKKAVDHYNEKFSELLERIGEDFEFAMPASEIVSLVKDSDPGSKEEIEKEWESQQFIRDMLSKIKQEFPDADEKEVIKQTSKEVFKAANEAGDIPEDNEGKKGVVKDIVDKVKTVAQEEDPTSETDKEIPEEQKEEIKANVEQEIDNDDVDTEELKADEPKQEEIADKAAETVIQNLPQEEKPKTEEEKTELKKTLIDIALEEVREFLKGTNELGRVSMEEAKKLIETDAYKILSDYAKDMNEEFMKVPKAGVHTMEIKEIEELVERVERGIVRINAITRDKSGNIFEVKIKRSQGTPAIERSSIMRPLNDSYNAIKRSLKSLRKALKNGDKSHEMTIIYPVLQLKYHFYELAQFDQNFRKAIKKGDEELAQKALEDQQKAKEEIKRKAKEEAKKNTPKKGEFYKYISPPSETEDPEQKEKIEDSFVKNSIYKIATQPTISTDPKTRRFQINFESVKTKSQQLPTVKLKDSIFYKSFKKVKKPEEEEPFKYDDDPPPPQKMARQIKVGKDGTRTGENVFVKQEQLERKLEKLIEHYLKNRI